MDEVTIQYRIPLSGKDLRSPVMIEGLPGIGHVGKLVAEHLIRELQAESCAEVHSFYFPPHAIIDEDGVIRLANNEIWLYRGGERDYLFITGDYQSSENIGHYVLADAFVNLAAELGVTRIYTLGGFGVGHLVEEPRVLAAVNRADLRGSVEAAGAFFHHDEPSGGIVGAAGLIPGFAAIRGIEGICLMGETSGYLVDPKSAASLLRVLSALTGLVADPTRLHDRGAEMERALQRLIEGQQASQDEELRYIG